MPRKPLLKLDSRLLDHEAAQAADGFEYGFVPSKLGLTHCVHCDGNRALLKFSFSEGELHCLVSCQECGAVGAGYSVSGEAHPHGQYVLAQNWHAVLAVGFHRWQLANDVKPVQVQSFEVYTAGNALEAGFGTLHEFLGSRRLRPS